MRARGTRLELGMALTRDEVGMVFDLYHLDEPAVRRGSAHREARVDELLAKRVVHLVAMAMALADEVLAVDAMG